MDFSRQVEQNRRALLNDIDHRIEIALWPFAYDLDWFLGDLFQGRLPTDWRQQWHAFVADQATKGFFVEPKSVVELEDWIEAWAGFCELLPVDVDRVASKPAEAVVHGTGDPSMDLIHREAIEAWMPTDLVGLGPAPMVRGPGNAPRVTNIEVQKGIGARYDEAVASGQYDPNILTRIAVMVARVFFPDSAPTTVTTYSDGTTHIMLGGGPSSGALGGQAAAILGVTAAASQGKLVVEVTETVVDAAFQEATGSPVGPTTLRGRPKDAQTDGPRKPSRRAEPSESVVDPEISRRSSQEPATEPRANGPEKTDRHNEFREPDPDTQLERPLQFWTRWIEFEGKKVYQRDDLIDPKLVDDSGQTNTQRMQRGQAPRGPDGKSIQLHHMLQTDDGPLAEMTEAMHRHFRKPIHINPVTMPTGIDRGKFDALRRRYWIKRALDFRS